MQNEKLRLDVWREAERRLDALALGSSEWQEAEEELQSAAKAFRAELAQASARSVEEEFQGRNRWFGQLDRGTSEAGDSVAGASLARSPQR